MAVVNLSSYLSIVLGMIESWPPRICSVSLVVVVLLLMAVVVSPLGGQRVRGPVVVALVLLPISPATVIMVIIISIAAAQGLQVVQGQTILLEQLPLQSRGQRFDV